MRNLTGIVAATAAAALLLGAGPALADPSRVGHHAGSHGHAWHGGARHARPAFAPPAPAAPFEPAAEPIAPPPRPYGGCIPTGPRYDSYGAFVAGGC